MTQSHSGEGPWLSIIGIGEDGLSGLSGRATQAISDAEIVFGGARHLALAKDLVGDRAHPWPTPFTDGISAVIALRGRCTCVLASGDPMFYGVGATLAQWVEAREMEIIPAPSSISLAAARLGWPLATVRALSLHGRSTALLRPALQPGAKLLVLTSGPKDLLAIGEMMVATGFGSSVVTILEAIGGSRERRLTLNASALSALHAVDPLHIVAIECRAEVGHQTLALAPGREDDLFEHDGQISKREIRSVILALLAPRQNERLWDIGAGSGSVGIEWLLAHPSMHAIAIEPRPDRAARIKRNAERLGVPDLAIVEGRAPEALTSLPKPDAIFIGGGATALGAIDTALESLRAGGRLVAAAVTLETEALLLGQQGRMGGSLTRLSVDRSAALGRMTGWRPARPVTLWSWSKPCS